MPRFVVRILIHAASVGCAAAILPGVEFAGEGTGLLTSMLFVGLLFGLVNALVRPLAAFATCGLYVLTLGMFHFVVNAFMLQLTAWLAGDVLMVDGFFSAFLGALVISVVGTGLTVMFDPEEEGEDDGVITIRD
jgi:putative membrane protein